MNDIPVVPEVELIKSLYKRIRLSIQMTKPRKPVNQSLAFHWMAANRLKLNVKKTELLWAGSRYSAAVLGNNGPSLKLGQDIVAPSNHVRVLGVTFSSDLSLDDDVARVSATCFYWLRQFRRV